MMKSRNQLVLRFTNSIKYLLAGAFLPLINNGDMIAHQVLLPLDLAFKQGLIFLEQLMY
jgi:hypothetical protein